MRNLWGFIRQFLNSHTKMQLTVLVAVLLILAASPAQSSDLLYKPSVPTEDDVCSMLTKICSESEYNPIRTYMNKRRDRFRG
ncbi:hypothetical protein D915_005660 [Fasciola hepatica]|uniref:Uncharacterized protein n=1 Tax=Fasciola hepatica TaxID=6192 RepID=A0A4E0RS06_FASHE|nr:hypothetical protein D915_005660 [Fasciola hepatica]